MRGSLLGLEAGASPSRREIENSSCFRPRMAASETELPEVIAEHWLPILRGDSLLVECPPDQFTTPADWIPLLNGPINHKVLDCSRFGTTLFMLNIVPSNTARV